MEALKTPEKNATNYAELDETTVRLLDEKFKERPDDTFNVFDLRKDEDTGHGLYSEEERRLIAWGAIEVNFLTKNLVQDLLLVARVGRDPSGNKLPIIDERLFVADGILKKAGEARLEFKHQRDIFLQSAQYNKRLAERSITERESSLRAAREADEYARDVETYMQAYQAFVEKAQENPSLYLESIDHAIQNPDVQGFVSQQEAGVKMLRDAQNGGKIPEEILRAAMGVTEATDRS